MITKEQLEDLYIYQKLDITQISKKLNICRTSVFNLLKKYSIKTRKRGGIPWNTGLTKDTNEKIKLLGENHSKVLKEKYTNNQLQIWNKGLTKQTDERMLVVATKRKDYVEKTGCMKGESNPFSGKQHTEETKSRFSILKGGTGIPYENADYPKEWNDELKYSIRKRDDYRCQRPDCTMTQEEHLIVYGRDLDVHHIDYNKQNCSKTNLISLCIGCHTRTNVNRYYWQPLLAAKVTVLNES